MEIQCTAAQLNDQQGSPSTKLGHDLLPSYFYETYHGAEVPQTAQILEMRLRIEVANTFSAPA